MFEHRLQRTARAFATSVAISVAVALAGCSTLPQSASDQRRLSTVVVDSALTPRIPALSPYGDGQPRVLAHLVDAKGYKVDFVQDELIVTTDDDQELADIVQRWHGSVIRTIRPADFGMPNLAAMHLVRIDPIEADTSALPRELAAINPDVRGDLRVSSPQGVSLLTAAAHEVANGRRASVNWVAQPHLFADKVSNEAPTGAVAGGYTPNAFAWGYMTTKTWNHIGVADAWRVLEEEDRLQNRVKVAVLDAGFSSTADYPPGFVFLTTIPGIKLGDPYLDDTKPFHGSWVVQTLAAVPDNGFGTAGVAGPVTDLVMIYIVPDLYTMIAGIFEAVTSGARIINISAGAGVPAVITLGAKGLGPLNDVTAAVRSAGILIFASAGNDGVNVDAYDGPYEEAWFTPCENDGVICVGGQETALSMEAASESIEYNSSDPGSNYGPEQVNLYAPFAVFVGVDPTHTKNEVFPITGTSFSSPFAAGVAALIWAAKPELIADQVEDLLFTWAHVLDDNGKKSVNAISPVKHLLVPDANYPPSIEITSPAPGDKVGYGGLAIVNFTAKTDDFEETTSCCTVTWSTNVDGVIGVGKSLQFAFSSPGQRWITATAKDSEGATAEAYVFVTAQNDPPVVEILKPLPGETIYKGSSKPVLGTVYDANEPLTALCNSAEWKLLQIGSPTYHGCTPAVAFTSLGQHVLKFTGTDSQGASATATVTVNVIDPPASGPPDVTIYLPKPGAVFDVGENALLSGQGVDPDTHAVVPQNAQTYHWSIKYDAVETPITPTVSDWGFSYFKPSDYVPATCSEQAAEVRLRVTDPQGEQGSSATPITVIGAAC